MRGDAVRNRDRILAIAKSDFTQRGINVSLESIAARAGVGIGTLYRRFPTRDDLVVACYEPAIEAIAQYAEDALADPDPWQSFAEYLHRICAMQAVDKGLRDVFRTTFSTATTLEAARARTKASFHELARRAQAAHALREDFVVEDIELLLVANASVLDVAPPDSTGPASVRFVALMLEAFRADRAHPLPAPPQGHLLRPVE